jgi:phosphoribosyl 1,2-cyclic phosphodiesterase
VKLRFWGARGSFATPGNHYLRSGGNTSAVEIVSAGGDRLLIDLGTGATELARDLMQGEFGRGAGKLPILLTHTHLDHIQGLPFFTPFFIKGNQIRIMGIEPSELSLADTLQNQLNGHYSPLYGLENLAAGVQIDTIAPGESLPVPGFQVRSAALPHGGMNVLGFRIEADGKSVAYLSDVEYPSGVPTPEALALAKGADLLVHDAMFSDFEYQSRRGWGHSPVSAALDVAARAGVKRLALFHHSPDATDAEIDAVTEEARSKVEVDVFGAAEGPAIEV